jgi:hypothetical protein
MSKLGSQLLSYMFKWSGKSGGLILVNELKKQGISDVENMTQEQKFKLVNALTNDYLSTFLGQSKFLMARAELLSIMSLSSEDFYPVEQRSRKVPESPNLFGMPKE